MKWIYGILFIIAVYILMGIFKPLDAQEIPKERPFEWTPTWTQRAISCGPLDQIAQIGISKGLKIVWRGTGIGNKPDVGIVRVDIFLSINPETKEWALTEIGPTPNVGCLIGYGVGQNIDVDNLKLFQPDNKG